MTTGRKPGDPSDDDVVNLNLDEPADDVARAIAEAERAVAAVEERHSHKGRPAPASSATDDDAIVIDADEEDAAPEADPRDTRLRELHEQVASEKERAIRAEEEAGRLRETLLRKTADFENLKRRTEKEKTDFFKFALAEAFRDITGVVDNFDRALAHGPEAASGDEFRSGIEMIAKQLTDTLRKYGLVEIPADGRPFDPNFHEAVMREDTNAVPPGTVMAVFQKGYTLNDRLLRPALVKVSGAPQAPRGDEPAH